MEKKMKSQLEELKKLVKEKAVDMGMDLVGITDLLRLNGAPKRFQAIDYLPNAKSVMVVGCKIPEGSVENWAKTPSSYQYLAGRQI